MSDQQEKAKPGTVLRIEFPGGPIWLQVLELRDGESVDHDEDGVFSILFPLEEGEDPGLCLLAECAGQIWRRPPFRFYGLLFWRDVDPAKIEFLGAADSPPDAFLRGSRSPTDAVDFETGGGPWYVSDGGVERVVTWLSSEMAQLPYEVRAYWPGGHDFCRFHGKYAPLPEINERAVRFGQEMERRGEAPAEIANPALHSPPYPKTTARKAALRIGDLVKIPTVHGLAYLQVTPWEGTFGKLLRVFDGYWPVPPDSFSPAMFRTKFLICVPYVRDLIEHGVCRKAGKIALVDDTGELPATRGNIVFEEGRYETCVYQANGRTTACVTPEHASLSNSTTGYARDTLIERLDLDWRPETDLWVQVALEHNQNKLGHSGPGFIRRAKARIGAFLGDWTGPAQAQEELSEEPEFEEEVPHEPVSMTEDDFWAVITRINELAAKPGGSWDFRRGALMMENCKMSAAEVMAFDDHLHRKMNIAYSWSLWAAAYIIHGGCSDDAFKDFRSCLIFLGRDIYEAALDAADSLAALDDEMLKGTQFEGLFYVAPQAFEEKTGAELARTVPGPDEPAGQEWDEDDEAVLAALCPRLWARFGN